MLRGFGRGGTRNGATEERPAGDDARLQDPYGTGDDEENQPDPNDPFAGLDDETRDRLEAYYSEREEGYRQQIRDSLDAVGLDVSDEFQPRLKTPEKFLQYADTLRPAPAQPAAPAAREPERAEEEAIPDMYEDPKGFRDFVNKLAQEQAKAIVEEQVKPVTQQTQTFAERHRQEQVGLALAAVPDIFLQMFPAMEELLDDPGFEEAMVQALMGAPEDQWNNEVGLASAIGFVVPRYQATRQQAQPRFRPAQPQPRRQDGRYAPYQGQQQQARRPSWQQQQEEDDYEEQPVRPWGQRGAGISPRRAARAQWGREVLPLAQSSRGAGRRQQPQEYDAETMNTLRQHQERFGMSMAEVEATLSDPDSPAAVKARRQRLRGGS